MKTIQVIFVFLMLLPFVGGADLVHYYTFTGSTPLEDTIGDADLAEYGKDGNLTLDPEGFVHFDGLNGEASAGDVAVYLGSDALTAAYDPFVLSIWFRIPTNTEQPEYSGLFSSYAGTADGFQVNFLNGQFGIHTSSSDLNITAINSLTTNEWHLVTIMQDPTATHEGQIWVDGSLTASQTDSFGVLQDFRLGVNRNGERSFIGDIAEISIYNNETWDDTKQTDAFLAGPVIPEPAVISLILCSGLTLLLTQRIFTA